MIKIAVIGSFWLSKCFVRAVDEVEGAQFCAVYSRDADRAKDFWNYCNDILIYDSLENMLLSQDIDAVYVASPNTLHFAQAKQCLVSGKHVICEKPIAISLSEFLELKQIADTNNLIIIEAMMNYYTPQTQVLKDRIADSGNVVSARIDFSQRSSKLDRVNNGEVFSSFSKDMCGGSLMDLGVYCLNLIVNAFGAPNKVIAYSDIIGTGVDGSGGAVLEFDGFHVIATYSKMSESRIRSEILCDNASFTIGSVSQMLDIVEVDISGNKKIIYEQSEHYQSMKHEIRSFVEFVNSRNNNLAYKQATAVTVEVLRILDKIKSQL